MKVMQTGINGLGETLSRLQLSAPPLESTPQTVSATDDTSTVDEMVTDDPVTFSEIMNQEKTDRARANADKSVLKYYGGKWHLSPHLITFKNLNVPQLWELWYNGSQADPKEPIPPYRQLLDSDFVRNSSCRKAKGLMERLHFIIAQKQLAKKSVPINTMKLSEFTNLGVQAMRALYSSAVEKSMEAETPIDTKRDLMSMSFATFFDRVSPFIKLPEELQEMEPLKKNTGKRRKIK
jgi:hypothetical protein